MEREVFGEATQEGLCEVGMGVYEAGRIMRPLSEIVLVLVREGIGGGWRSFLLLKIREPLTGMAPSRMISREGLMLIIAAFVQRVDISVAILNVWAQISQLLVMVNFRRMKVLLFLEFSGVTETKPSSAETD